MTVKEIDAAFDAQCPVVHRGITYQRISIFYILLLSRALFSCAALIASRTVREIR